MNRGSVAALLLSVALLCSPSTGVQGQALADVPPPDLFIRSLDRSAVVETGPVVSGDLWVTVANQGAGDAPATRIAVFTESAGDGVLSPVDDLRLGVDDVPALGPGGHARVAVPLSGTLRLRGARLLAAIDVDERVPEVDESNNLRDTAASCLRPARPLRPKPRLEWSWRSSDLAPDSYQVIAVPAVADLDDDGFPEIAFVTFTRETGRHPDHHERGILRVVEGRTGAERFAVVNPAFHLRPNTGVSAADLDGDGRAEILGVSEDSQHVLAFKGDGSLLWKSDAFHAANAGAIAVADLEADGRPEVIVGVTVLESDGSLRWSKTPEELAGHGRGRGSLQTVVVPADVDLDGRLEIVAGSTVYRADGTVLWNSPVVDDGFAAPVNLDDDPYPEFALVRLGQLYALDDDGSRIWGPVALPGGTFENKGGPPAIADIDGDSYPEIIVADRAQLAVFHSDGSLRWREPIADITSKSTSVSLFDFEGDGIPEIVHGDERFLRIVRGVDGGVWWSATSSNGTQVELPLIADVDGDGRAEIVRVANSYAFGNEHGIEVYGMDEAWMGAPSVWNQHAFSAGSAGPGGQIPRWVAPGWLAHNTFRTAQADLRNLRASDASLSELWMEHGGNDEDELTIVARLGSVGAVGLPVGTTIRLDWRVPGGSEQPLAELRLDETVPPGRSLDLRWPWPDAATVIGVAGGQVVANVHLASPGSDCQRANDSSTLDVDGVALATPQTATPMTPTPPPPVRHRLYLPRVLVRP